MEQQSNGIFFTGFSWLSSKMKKLVGKDNSQQNKTLIYLHKKDSIEGRISKSESQPFKDSLINRLRREKAQQGVKNRVQAIQKFMNKRVPQKKSPEFICPICIDIMIQPVATVCGHTFCYRCLDQALLFNAVCPVCRTYIRNHNLTISKCFQSIIQNYMQKIDDQEYLQTYKQKNQDFLNWKQGRSLKPHQINQNDQIDVRDTEFIWCKAKIVQLIKKKDKVTGVLIHYEGWNKIYDQIIDIDSHRLASFKFYTQRNDIPRYRLSQENNEIMYSAVSLGLNELHPSIQRRLQMQGAMPFDFLIQQELQNEELLEFIENDSSSSQQQIQAQRQFQGLSSQQSEVNDHDSHNQQGSLNFSEALRAQQQQRQQFQRQLKEVNAILYAFVDRDAQNHSYQLDQDKQGKQDKIDKQDKQDDQNKFDKWDKQQERMQEKLSKKDAMNAKKQLKNGNYLGIKIPQQEDYQQFQDQWCMYCGSRYSNNFFPSKFGEMTLCQQHKQQRQILDTLYQSPKQPLQPSKNTQLSFLNDLAKKRNIRNPLEIVQEVTKNRKKIKKE